MRHPTPNQVVGSPVTSTLQRVDGPADAELIAAVRAGDTEAYGVLFERHVDAARRLSRQLVSGPDVDDLVAEAFGRVLSVLQRGGGPDLAFRAYLLTAVRRLHVDRIRAASRLHTTDDLTPFDPGVPFHDTAVEGFETTAAARAFASLPERWQLVLWHTEVEGQRPADIAPLLGMSANAVAALAYRAREGLRQAFLSMHVQSLEDDECEWVHQHLGGYVRGGVSRRDATRIEEHLAQCRPCAAIHLELTEVNDGLAGLLAPALLGGLAAAYVASGSGSVGVGGTVLALLDRARDGVLAHQTATAAAGVAATVAVGGTLFVTQPPASDPSPTPPAAAAPDAPDARAGSESARRPVAGTRIRPQPTPSAEPTAPPASPPSAQPTQQPQPTPAPSPATDSPATPDTREPEPSATPPDLAVKAVASQSGQGSTRIAVTVTGLPPGSTATLTSRTDGLVVLVGLDERCRPTAPNATACAVTRTPTTFVFLASAPRSGSVVFRVVPDEGSDADPADNSATVEID